MFNDLFKLKLTSYQTFLGWGMSELSPLALLNPLDAPRDGSCGIAVPNTVFKVADVSTGENLAPNKEGEICCKGPMVLHTQPKTHFMAKTCFNKFYNCGHGLLISSHLFLLGNEGLYKQ